MTGSPIALRWATKPKFAVPPGTTISPPPVVLPTQPSSMVPSQLSSTLLHTSGGGGPPTQAPSMHVSLVVQALPSLHTDPSGFDGLEQIPLAVSQVPVSWHWSSAV